MTTTKWLNDREVREYIKNAMVNENPEHLRSAATLLEKMADFLEVMTVMQKQYHGK